VDAPFVVGAGVDASQLELIRRGIALANGYFRVRLGRELSPNFTVYVFADLEGIAAAYAQATANSLEHGRQLWASTTAVTQSRGLFIYAASQGWASSSETARLKIIAHEAFHLLQGELAGPATLNSGDAEVPAAGPRWLSEGAAELVAHRVLAENRLATFEAIRERWISVTKTVSAPLSALEIATDFRAVGGAAYELAPLAADRLIEGIGEGAFVAYWERIGQGAPWRDSFAAVFRRGVDAFYEEFASYRSRL
jgi:hypothetical protein